MNHLSLMHFLIEKENHLTSMRLISYCVKHIFLAFYMFSYPLLIHQNQPLVTWKNMIVESSFIGAIPFVNFFFYNDFSAFVSDNCLS